MTFDMHLLTNNLQYEFVHKELLEQALTHCSAGPTNNERLEFLGDALIGLIIAEVLIARFPQANEGILSRMRASLVKRESLAQLARGMQLGEYLRLGAGELRTGGSARDSILSDAVEALFGALYLDAGFVTVKSIVLKLFANQLNELGETQIVGKDPKTRLQEILQATKRALPEYLVLTVDGDQHAQLFTVSCQLPELDLCTQGQGTSRRRAEQAAAEAMLGRMTNDS